MRDVSINESQVQVNVSSSPLDDFSKSKREKSIKYLNKHNGKGDNSNEGVTRKYNKVILFLGLRPLPVIILTHYITSLMREI